MKVEQFRSHHTTEELIDIEQDGFEFLYELNKKEMTELDEELGRRDSTSLLVTIIYDWFSDNREMN